MTENTAAQPANDPMADIDIDAELAVLLGTSEPTTPVVLLVPNGHVVDGKPMLVPMAYEVTTTTLMHAQALLANGSTTNVRDVMSRAIAAITAVVADKDLAEQVAAQLAEQDLLK